MKSEATSGNAKKISPNADLPFTGKLWDINAHSPLFADEPRICAFECGSLTGGGKL